MVSFTCTAVSVLKLLVREAGARRDVASSMLYTQNLPSPN